MQKETLNLFNDVEDLALKSNNRAAIMANLFEDNMLPGNRNTSSKGAAHIMAYYLLIPRGERKLACTFYKDMMNERGFAYVGGV